MSEDLTNERHAFLIGYQYAMQSVGNHVDIYAGESAYCDWVAKRRGVKKPMPDELIDDDNQGFSASDCEDF